MVADLIKVLRKNENYVLKEKRETEKFAVELRFESISFEEEDNSLIAKISVKNSSSHFVEIEDIAFIIKGRIISRTHIVALEDGDLKRNLTFKTSDGNIKKAVAGDSCRDTLPEIVTLKPNEATCGWALFRFKDLPHFDKAYIMINIIGEIGYIVEEIL